MNNIVEELVFSAPGKVILHGDHSVVYGKRGVALSLDLRTTLTLTRNEDAVCLDLPDVDICESWPLAAVDRLCRVLHIENNSGQSDECLSKKLSPEKAALIRSYLGLDATSKCQKIRAILSFFHLYTSVLSRAKGFTVHVSSKIPTGAGLGSSAAYASCLAASLLAISGRVPPEYLSANAPLSVRRKALEVVNYLTYASETIMHGTPSGIDNTTCTHGGIISFKNGEMEVLDGNCPLQILLVDTRIPRSTETMVKSVRKKYDAIPSVITPMLESMDAIAEEALEILRQLSDLGNLNECSEKRISLQANLGELMRMNHMLLSALGVSHPSIDKIVSLSAEHGLQAKLTGAGGGGFSIVLLTEERGREASLCVDALRKSGYALWRVHLGVQGLVCHT